MCTHCGCSSEGAHPRDHAHPHPHPHDDHDHPPGNGAPRPGPRRIRLEQEILAKNDRLADRNREWLADRRILALNLMSSPGSGKTTLLERTIVEIGDELSLSVIEGDQETERDAERIRATGRPVVQINTGSGCHLDAEMVERGLRRLDPPDGSVVMIENVGNLVCPALFDLGEHSKVVVASVTEGEDKPLKYPHMFHEAHLMLLNKIDLLPHLDFDVEDCLANARRVNPEIGVIELSAATGEGFDRWTAWLREGVRAMVRSA